MLLLTCTSLHAQPLQITTQTDTKINPATTHRMLRHLEHKDWIFAAAAVHYCAAHRIQSALPAVNNILNNTGRSAWLRGRAMVAITQLNSPQAFNTVSKFVSDKDPVLRSALAQALGFSKHPKAAALITQLIQDSNQQVHFHALVALAKHSGAKAWPVINKETTSLPNKASKDAQRLAVRSLAFVATPESIARIDQWISQGMDRALVTQALRDISDPTLIPLLLRILAHTYIDGRDFATLLTALHRMPRPSLIAAMKSAIKTNDSSLIRAVARVNAKVVSAPELGDSLHLAATQTQGDSTIRAVLSTLGDNRMKPSRYVVFFQKQLKHQDSDVRVQAIRCLAHCPNLNLYTALKPTMEEKDEAVLRVALTTLLTTSTDDAPRGQLVEYLQLPLSNDTPAEYKSQITVRILALKVLAKAGDETDFVPAFALLNNRLRSTDPQLRQSAAIALGSIASEKDKLKIAASQGFLTRWQVIGTFLNTQTNENFDKPFPPETKIDFAQKYKAKYVWTLEGHRKDQKGEIEREIEWVEAAVDSSDGKLEIAPLVPPPASLAVGYAVADFKLTAAKEVTLDIDGDDAFRVWLNDVKISEKVATYQRRQPSIAEHRGIKVKLKAGLNRMFIKTSNIDFEWWVRVRITDANGRPVEVNTQ